MAFIPKNKLLTLSTLISVLFISSFSYAENDSDVNWGADLSVRRDHQKFDETDADLNTFSLQPYVQLGNWDISLSLPWQKIDGEYFVNGFQPNPSRICQRLSSLTPLQRLVLVNRGNVTPEQLDYCDNQTVGTAVVNDSVSGMSDMSLFVRYATPLDKQGIWLGSFGVGYKFDNGDVNSGLGSGTRNTSIDTAISFLSGKWTGYAALGYTLVSGGIAYTTESETDEGIVNHYYDDYAYVTLDGGYKFTPWLTVGASANTQQASFPESDDVQWVTAYVTIKMYKKFRVRTYFNSYLDVSGYPEEEFGASLGYSF